MINIKIKNKEYLTNIPKINNNIFNFNVTEGDPYLYFFPIDPVPSYFVNNKEVGFRDLDSSVKHDIRNGKCKLIVYAGDEGYFGSDNDIELPILNTWVLNENFPPYSVHFICMNLIIDETLIKKNIKIKGHPYVCNSEKFLNYPDRMQSKDFYNVGLVSNFKLFLNYNKSVTNRSYRIYLLLSLIKNKLTDNGLISFSSKLTKKLFNFHQRNFNVEFDDMIVSTATKMTPMFINNFITNDSEKTVSDGFIGQELILYDYRNTFLSLISETLEVGGAVYLSEKTFKPILAGHPFMLISSKNSLKKLKELGYKTFDKWWDESYDACDEYIDRIGMIINELNILKSKSNDELIKLRLEMMEVLKHNQLLYKERVDNLSEINNILFNVFKEIKNENNISYRL